MPEVIPFQDALAATSKGRRALVVGNGFSVEYFHYANLLNESGIESGSPLHNLFFELGSPDFEKVVRALEDAAVVERAYENADRSAEFLRDAQSVRDALVRAVQKTHPAHRDELAFKYESSAAFLSNFATVFSLNYDLLLYWVNLQKAGLGDGFGLAEKTAGGRFLAPFSEEGHCGIYNLHGGLHLFDNGAGEMMKALDTGDGVIATITAAIEGGRLPTYVAEGTAAQKLSKINSVAYLRHCLDQLRSNADPVFIFGHSAHETDGHVYRAIFSSECRRLFFGVHGPTDEKVRNLDGELARYQRVGGTKVEYAFYDSETAHVWDA